MAHGGVEHIDRPLPQWRCAYRRCVDLGADAVIAHHPHCTQGIETYCGAPIFYSIGNFYFHAIRPYEHFYHAQIPILYFEKGTMVSYEVNHSCHSVGATPSVLPDLSDWGQPRTRRLSDELLQENAESYRAHLNHDLAQLWSNRFAPGFLRSILSIRGNSPIRLLATLLRAALGRVSLTDYMMLEHFLEIESHRWAITEIMRQKRNTHRA